MSFIRREKRWNHHVQHNKQHRRKVQLNSFELFECLQCRLSSKASVILGSSSNDSNENSNKPIGIDWQNNNFARASRVFVHFFAVVARLQRENA